MSTETGAVQAWAGEAWEKALAKTKHNVERIGSEFPHASQGGRYVLEAPHWWTAGFWPGLLWQLHAGSGDAVLRETAERCEERLDEVLDGYVKLDHDLGFMWQLTGVANYMLTGNPQSRIRALKAANYLMGRFNLKGRYIRAWNPWREGENNSGVAIIDCCMNMSLLFWASRETGDPRYRHVAEAHMDTVLEHFIRPDGSVYHIVNFDPDTGEVAEFRGGQGYAPESAWSRGAALAIYGLALAYHHSGKKEYLTASQKVAHFFITRLPADYAPAWDFRAPGELRELRDTSAGSCAASGLLLLASLVDRDAGNGESGELSEGAVYRTAGERMLESLYRNYGTWDNPDEEGMLLHGTSNYPEDRNIDVPLIYGDFFYVEGLARLKGCGPFYWE